MKLPFNKEKIIKAVLTTLEKDPQKRAELEQLAKLIAKLGYKIDSGKKLILLDFTDVKKEQVGWRVYVIVDRNAKRGCSFEL